MLIDTHAHLQFGDSYSDNLEEVLAAARSEDVQKIVCVGVDEQDSAKATALAEQYDHIYAAVGLHPHDAKLGESSLHALSDLLDSTVNHQPSTVSKIVAIGECGLDYYYNHSPQPEQEAAFRSQIELAQAHDLPMMWHVRDAFSDFFRIVDDYPGLRGIVHSFTGTPAEAAGVVARGFSIALNGIMTFTKDQQQLEAAKSIPLDRLVLETDCPFLAPVPHRGKPNQPAYIKHTAEFLARLRGESVQQLSDQTSQNAMKLLGLN